MIPFIRTTPVVPYQSTYLSFLLYDKRSSPISSTYIPFLFYIIPKKVFNIFHCYSDLVLPFSFASATVVVWLRKSCIFFAMISCLELMIRNTMIYYLRRCSTANSLHTCIFVMFLGFVDRKIAVAPFCSPYSPYHSFFSDSTICCIASFVP